jgi:biotin carboxyl carrier protein
MKMENEVVAAVDGIITQVLVGKGSVVKTGDPLVLIH